jgi:toxin ParE1/3/4
MEQGVRRCLLNRFPYGIIYSPESDVIFILAIMNLHRHPDYWKNRKERTDEKN